MTKKLLFLSGVNILSSLLHAMQRPESTQNASNQNNSFMEQIVRINNSIFYPDDSNLIGLMDEPISVRGGDGRRYPVTNLVISVNDGKELRSNQYECTVTGLTKAKYDKISKLFELTSEKCNLLNHYLKQLKTDNGKYKYTLHPKEIIQKIILKLEEINTQINELSIVILEIDSLLNEDVFLNDKDDLEYIKHINDDIKTMTEKISVLENNIKYKINEIQKVKLNLYTK